MGRLLRTPQALQGFRSHIAHIFHSIFLQHRQEAAGLISADLHEHGDDPLLGLGAASRHEGQEVLEAALSHLAQYLLHETGFNPSASPCIKRGWYQW